ncbi:MAG: hypothetical protein R3A49_02970 [Acidimicrobiia bacterium]
MPWCLTCDRYLSPSTVNADGTCRTCGKPVETADVVEAGRTLRSRESGAGDDKPESDDDRVPLPWHLWALLAALVIYLGFRFWQGVEALWNWAL